MRAIVVVASELEARRLSNLDLTLYVSGIGSVNAALATMRAIEREHPDLVVSTGIGGAYPSSGLQPGDVAISSEIVYGALGAMDGARFLDLAELGFPLVGEMHNRLPVWQGAASWASRANAAFGPLLTLETVTGDDEIALVLERRFPGALTEGMEGAGVAHAALLAGVAAVEVRGVSNMVGRRDRSSWRLPEALDAVKGTLARLDR
ncbi:futalosine hydrolase [Deinococcus yavapaiensis]|uniref:Futalosine hydrolase n=1 Tax=Deinococcus yavapaiensis KR-236 TaxID=694435 RepID=A0A318SSA3_9DEIO|nr:futalosine hydrolase [Deinococcus yavapaiensis]PYE55897.1 futalosine hydrolase [Deinococcus yavapaiensis KR-236]